MNILTITDVGFSYRAAQVGETGAVNGQVRSHLDRVSTPEGRYNRIGFWMFTPVGERHQMPVTDAAILAELDAATTDEAEAAHRADMAAPSAVDDEDLDALFYG